MRLSIVAVLAIALTAHSNVVSADQPEQATISSVNTPGFGRSLATGDNNNVGKRSLRVHDTLDEIDDRNEEERGLLEKFQFWRWFKKGMDPMKLYKKLGLEGLGENAYKNANYQKYLDFSEYWRKMQ